MTTPGSHGPDEPSRGGTPAGGQPAGSPGGYSPPPPGGATPPPPPPPGGSGQGQYQPQPGEAPYPPQGQPYPPQGGAPYPPQGGAPYPPHQGAHAQGGFGVPQKSGRPKWLIPVIAGVVLIVAALALFVLFAGAGEAEIGDCVAATSDDEVEVVDCDDDSAAARVIGIQDGELSFSEYLADPNTCSEFPESIGAFWQGQEGEDGTVLCVGAL